MGEAITEWCAWLYNGMFQLQETDSPNLCLLNAIKCKKPEDYIHLKRYKTNQWGKEKAFWPGLSETTYGVRNKKLKARRAGSSL